MGTRVEFMLGAKDGLESIILKSMPQFKDWYKRCYEEYPLDFDLEIIDLTDQILSAGRSVLDVKSSKSAQQVDKLVDSFVGDYCDHGGGRKLLNFVQTKVMKVHHYYEQLEHFDKTSTAFLFWNFILKGRPLSRNAEAYPYKPTDEVFRVSYVTLGEIQKLKREFDNMNFFGDRESIAFVSAKDAITKAYEANTGLVMTVA